MRTKGARRRTTAERDRAPERGGKRAGTSAPAASKSSSQPFSWAMRAASARLRAPSFWIAADRWLRTVPGDRLTRAATFAMVSCPAAAASTSVSRWLSGLSPSASAAAASAVSTTRSPLATRRMASASCAAGASFSRKPAAPSGHGRAQVAGAPEGGHDHDLAREAGLRELSCHFRMPPGLGISMSRTATSGWCCAPWPGLRRRWPASAAT